MTRKSVCGKEKSIFYGLLKLCSQKIGQILDRKGYITTNV